ncbi:MAG: hypothetical protein AB1512_04335 [Thermodesulfobacteriota bacterium]
MMNEKCRPARSQGDRNVFCPFYGECLDYAIQEAWESWECTHCAQRGDQTAAPELPWCVNHTVAYYELPTRL